MSYILKNILYGLFLTVVTFQVQGQEIILNNFDVIERTALTNFDSTSIAFKSAVTYKSKREGDYLQILPIYSYTSLNSNFEYGFNDGYLWQGKGLNQTIVAGIQGRIGKFEYTLAPQFVYAQNTEFDLRSNYGTRPIYQDRFTSGIDYVKRYGDESLYELYLGQSELAYSLRNVRVSLNTQNSMWGPAIYSQGLMSNNANGFPNIRIGSDLPWNTRAGNVEMQWIFGITKESDYFNNDSSDDTQIFNGFVLGYEPYFIPGFSISLQRSLRLLEKDRTNNFEYAMLFTDFLRSSQHDSQGNVNESADQMFSFGLDWRSSNDDFRVYVEWIRGDFWSHINDLVTQPENSAGYVWGFVKRFKFKNDGILRFIFENANLAVWETSRIRSAGSLYTHAQVRQGYTNNGQVMGAFIGPGSSNHSINLSYHYNNKAIMFEYYRTRFNDDAFYLRLYEVVGNYQDIAHHFGLNFKNQFGPFEYLAGFDFAYRDNYLFVPDNYKFNLQPRLVLRYNFN